MLKKVALDSAATALAWKGKKKKPHWSNSLLQFTEYFSWNILYQTVSLRKIKNTATWLTQYIISLQVVWS